jgi:hypothetical protein
MDRQRLPYTLQGAVTDRHMMQRTPNAAELLRRIIAAQQRRRQLFQRIEDQTKRREDEAISPWQVVIRHADRARLAEVSIWHVERGAPSFEPGRGLSIRAMPPIIGFERD